MQIYAGPLLPTLDEEWLWFEREHLRTLYFNALQRLIQARRRDRDYGAALGYVQQALTEGPLREDMLRDEMALHYLLGDRAGAVHAF